MKYCKDCKYWVQNKYSDIKINFDKCSRIKIKSPISGEIYTDLQYCDVEREGNFIVCYIVNTCGKHARFFKPRKSK